MSNEIDNELEDVVGLTEAELEALKDEEEVTSEENNEESEDNKEESEDHQEESPQAAVQDQFIPQYQAPTPDNISQISAELDSSYENLMQSLETRYDEGDISFSEFSKQSRDLNSRYYAERAKIDAAILKADIAAEQSKQFAEQKWQWEQDVFFRDNPEFKTDPVLYGALDGVLKSLYADEANKGKSGLQFLTDAAKIVNAKLNPQIIQNNKQNIPDKPIQVRKTPELPKTLAGIPAAAENLQSKGEFDYLDNLSGMALEKAMSKLTPEQQDRYLRG